MDASLSLIDEGLPPAVPPRFNLAAHVLAGMARRPGHVALEILAPDGTVRRWRHGEIVAAIEAADAFFRRRLSPGSRVLLRLGNSVRFPIAFLGAIRAGMVPVPLSAQLTACEVGTVADDIAPALALVDPDLPLPQLEVPVLPEDELPTESECRHPPAPTAADAPAYIVFTSGSTGRPRAVVHAHRAILARQMMHRDWYDLRPNDRLLHAGAFNWTFTLGTGLMDPWSVGATALIPAPGTPPDALALLAGRGGATILAAVPGIYRKMLKEPRPIPSLRHGLAAGESLLPTLRNAWRETTGTDIHEALGMSEISTFISGSPARPAPRAAVGFAQRGRRVAILDPDTPSRILPRGEVGMLAVSRRDPGLFLGYLGAESETRIRFHAEWFLTGDLASLDETGAFRHHGRADDMMNAGGYRVFPREVEEALATHPGIAEVAVTDIEVKPGVRIIAAFCVPKEGTAPGRDEIVAIASKRLAVYKRPRRVVFLDALPRSANGKIDRRRLATLGRRGTAGEPADRHTSTGKGS